MKKLLKLLSVAYPDRQGRYHNLEIFQDESGAIFDGVEDLYEFESIKDLKRHLKKKIKLNLQF